MSVSQSNMKCKRSSTWIILSALLAGLFLMVFTDAGWTGPRGRGMHKGMHEGMQGGGRHERGGRALMQLESLTDEQREQIVELKAAAEKEKIRLQSEIKTLNVDLSVLMREENPNRNKLGKLAEQIAELRGELQKSRLMHRLDIHEILTDEQRDELKKMNREGRTHNKRHSRGRRGTGHRQGWCASPPPFQPEGSDAPQSED